MPNPKRRSSIERFKARRAREKRERRPHRKVRSMQARMADKKRSRAMRRGNMASKIAAIAASSDFPATLSGTLKHPVAYVNAVMEVAGYLTADPNVQTDDPREFASHFLKRSPVETNSAAGMAAVLFEAFLLQNEEALYSQMLETFVEPGDTHFLAIFEGPIPKDRLTRLVESVRAFMDAKVLVRYGDRSAHEVSDLTILECTPVPEGVQALGQASQQQGGSAGPGGSNYPRAAKASPHQMSTPSRAPIGPFEAVRPTCEADFDRILAEGGAPVAALDAWYPDAVVDERDGTLFLRAPDDTQWWSDDGRTWNPVSFLADAFRPAADAPTDEGRSVTPKYVLTLYTANGTAVSTPMAWSVKRDGKPTVANLKKWAVGFNQSLQPGGPNAHLKSDAKAVGAVLRYNTAPREVVATWGKVPTRAQESVDEIIGDTVGRLDLRPQDVRMAVNTAKQMKLTVVAHGKDYVRVAGTIPTVASWAARVTKAPGVRKAKFTDERTSAKESLDEAARNVELFYGTGGHGGPYPTPFEAIRRAKALLAGNPRETHIDVRPASTSKEADTLVRVRKRGKAKPLTGAQNIVVEAVDALESLDGVDEATKRNVSVTYRTPAGRTQRKTLGASWPKGQWDRYGEADKLIQQAFTALPLRTQEFALRVRWDPRKKRWVFSRPGTAESVDEALTPGLKNAWAKGRTKSVCPACGFALPVYPGRYPAQCPHCQATATKDPGPATVEDTALHALQTAGVAMPASRPVATMKRPTTGSDAAEERTGDDHAPTRLSHDPIMEKLQQEGVLSGGRGDNYSDHSPARTDLPEATLHVTRTRKVKQPDGTYRERVVQVQEDDASARYYAAVDARLRPYPVAGYRRVSPDVFTARMHAAGATAHPPELLDGAAVQDFGVYLDQAKTWALCGQIVRHAAGGPPEFRVYGQDPETYYESVEEDLDEAKDPPVIQQLRGLVKRHAYGPVKDPSTGRSVQVDVQTANAIVTVYDALKKPTNRTQFSQMAIPKMQSVAFKLLEDTDPDVEDLDDALPVDEVYRIKAKDRKVIDAFVRGKPAPSGANLDVVQSGDRRSLTGPSRGVRQPLAVRRASGRITLGAPHGTVSQTWINAVRKAATKAGVVAEALDFDAVCATHGAGTYLGHRRLSDQPVIEVIGTDGVVVVDYDGDPVVRVDTVSAVAEDALDHTSVNLLHEEQVTKAEADYIAGPVDTQSCDQCAFWRPGGTCVKVQGTIAPKGHCKLWQPRGAREDATPPGAVGLDERRALATARQDPKFTAFVKDANKALQAAGHQRVKDKVLAKFFLTGHAPAAAAYAITHETAAPAGWHPVYDTLYPTVPAPQADEDFTPWYYADCDPAQYGVTAGEGAVQVHLPPAADAVLEAALAQAPQTVTEQAAVVRAWVAWQQHPDHPGLMEHFAAFVPTPDTVPSPTPVATYVGARTDLDQMMVDLIQTTHEAAQAAGTAKYVWVRGDADTAFDALGEQDVAPTDGGAFLEVRPDGTLHVYAPDAPTVDEVAPPGFSGTVKAMKRSGEIANPYALAWAMYKKGATPHQPTEPGTPKYVTPKAYAKRKHERRHGPEAPPPEVAESVWVAVTGSPAQLQQAHATAQAQHLTVTEATTAGHLYHGSRDAVQAMEAALQAAGVPRRDRVDQWPIAEAAYTTSWSAPAAPLHEATTPVSLSEILTEAAPLESPDDPNRPLAKTFTQYVTSGNIFSPSGPGVFTEKLGRSAYKIERTMQGIQFVRTKAQTDELYRFPSSPMEEVLAEIDQFWKSKPDYAKFRVLHNRGILLAGAPGNGKSALIQQVADMMVQRGDPVFFATNISSLKEGLQAFRDVEPTRPVVVVLEDADEFLQYDQRQFLQLLDGDDAFEGVLYLATTNYLDRFPERLKRPGRFDTIVDVPPPPLEGRQTYLEHKLKGVEKPAEITRLAQATAGMSFGHLREFIVAVYVLKHDKDATLRRLRAQTGIPDPDAAPGEDRLLPVDTIRSMGEAKRTPGKAEQAARKKAQASADRTRKRWVAFQDAQGQWRVEPYDAITHRDRGLLFHPAGTHESLDEATWNVEVDDRKVRLPTAKLRDIFGPPKRAGVKSRSRRGPDDPSPYRATVEAPTAKAAVEKFADAKNLNPSYFKAALWKGADESTDDVTTLDEAGNAKSLAARLLTMPDVKQTRGPYGLGYRAYLRAVAKGQPTKHLLDLSDEKGRGARDARQELLYRLGESQDRASLDEARIKKVTKRPVIRPWAVTVEAEDGSEATRLYRLFVTLHEETTDWAKRPDQSGTTVVVYPIAPNRRAAESYVRSEIPKEDLSEARIEGATPVNVWTVRVEGRDDAEATRLRHYLRKQERILRVWGEGTTVFVNVHGPTAAEGAKAYVAEALTQGSFPVQEESLNEAPRSATLFPGKTDTASPWTVYAYLPAPPSGAKAKRLRSQFPTLRSLTAAHRGGWVLSFATPTQAAALKTAQQFFAKLGVQAAISTRPATRTQYEALQAGVDEGYVAVTLDTAPAEALAESLQSATTPVTLRQPRPDTTHLLGRPVSVDEAYYAVTHHSPGYDDISFVVKAGSKKKAEARVRRQVGRLGWIDVSAGPWKQIPSGWQKDLQAGRVRLLRESLDEAKIKWETHIRAVLKKAKQPMSLKDIMQALPNLPALRGVVHIPLKPVDKALGRLVVDRRVRREPGKGTRGVYTLVEALDETHAVEVIDNTTDKQVHYARAPKPVQDFARFLKKYGTQTQANGTPIYRVQLLGPSGNVIRDNGGRKGAVRVLESQDGVGLDEAKKVATKDRDILIGILRYGSRSGDTGPDLAGMIDGNPSARRVLAVAKKYAGQTFAGGTIEYEPALGRGAWSSHSPGVTNPRQGSGDPQPARIFVTRTAAQRAVLKKVKRGKRTTPEVVTTDFDERRLKSPGARNVLYPATKGAAVQWKAPNGRLMRGVVLNDVAPKYAVKVRVTHPKPKRPATGLRAGDDEVLVPRQDLRYLKEDATPLAGGRAPMDEAKIKWKREPNGDYTAEGWRLEKNLGGSGRGAAARPFWLIKDPAGRNFGDPVDQLRYAKRRAESVILAQREKGESVDEAVTRPRPNAQAGSILGRAVDTVSAGG